MVAIKDFPRFPWEDSDTGRVQRAINAAVAVGERVWFGPGSDPTDYTDRSRV